MKLFEGVCVWIVIELLYLVNLVQEVESVLHCYVCEPAQYGYACDQPRNMRECDDPRSMFQCPDCNVCQSVVRRERRFNQSSRVYYSMETWLKRCSLKRDCRQKCNWETNGISQCTYCCQGDYCNRCPDGGCHQTTTDTMLLPSTADHGRKATTREYAVTMETERKGQINKNDDENGAPGVGFHSEFHVFCFMLLAMVLH